MPIAGHARLIEGQGLGVKGQGSNSDASRLTPHAELLVIDGLVGSVSGDRIIKDSIQGKPEDAEKLGLKLAEELISKGAGKILAEVYSK